MKRNISYPVIFVVLMGIFPAGIHVSHAWRQCRPPAFLSPEIHPKRTVCFRFNAPQAGEVRLNTLIPGEERKMKKDVSRVWICFRKRKEELQEWNQVAFAGPEPASQRLICPRPVAVLMKDLWGGGGVHADTS